MPPPSISKVIAVAGSIVLATTAVAVALWWAGTAGLNGDKLVTARLDALRTGLSVGLGGGGALALYLAWRRQRAAEVALAQAATALAQKDRDHDHAETDARERRITDLYAKAVEQLGSDKAPVRLGGLYALERLAQGNPSQRQTIVNVMCAYLRMPYVPPGGQPADDADVVIIDTHRERVQEREVRFTAQRILAYHLRAKDYRGDLTETFWSGMNVNLSNAILIELNFSNVAIHAAFFDGVKFIGDTTFRYATFEDAAFFGGSQFTGEAEFESSTFEQYGSFTEAKFEGITNFRKAAFYGLFDFREVQFFGAVLFEQTVFAEGVPDEIERI